MNETNELLTITKAIALVREKTKEAQNLTDIQIITSILYVTHVEKEDVLFYINYLQNKQIE